MSVEARGGSRRGATRVGLAVCAAIILVPLGLFCSAPDENEGADGRPIWLVLTRPMFVEALQPLVEHRRSQGYEPVVSTQPIADVLDELERPPTCILLVGDHDDIAANAPWYLPTFRFFAFAPRIGHARFFSTDWLFGDLNRDFQLDVPVGRIPVCRVEELRIVVRKIISYETRPPSLDDIRVPILAGRPGFGPTIDSMATSLLVHTLTAKEPLWLEPWVLTADARHPLSYVPWQAPRLFARQLARGGLIAVMLGHGDPDWFAWARVRWGPVKKEIGYTAESVKTYLTAKDPGPPLFIFACYCGDFSFYAPSLGETCLLEPGGPVAVVAATTSTHAVMNYYSGISLLELLSGDERTVGGICMRMQAVAHKRRDIVIEQLAKRCSNGKLDMFELMWARRTHHMVYAVLGDPATVLRMPRALKGTHMVHRPDGWHWKARKPPNARRLHVGVRPPQKPFERSSMPFLPPPQWWKRFCEANQRFAFRTVVVLSADEPWEGVIGGEGTARLVALTDSDIYVDVVDLDAGHAEPESANAPPSKPE